MIEIRKKPGESVWEIDQRFKPLKGNLKYAITDMQHRHLFVKSPLPHLKYALRQFNLSRISVKRNEKLFGVPYAGKNTP